MREMREMKDRWKEVGYLKTDLDKTLHSRGSRLK